jgi:anti-anti-sigma factor
VPASDDPVDRSGLGEPIEPFVSRRQDHTVIGLHGEQDLATVERVREVLAIEIAVPCVDLLIDLTDVTFIDACTVGALVVARNALVERSRALTIRGAPACGRRIFMVCEVAEILPFTTSEQLDLRTDEMAVRDERERLATQLHDAVIRRIFAAGLSLHVTSQMCREPDIVERLAWIGDELDLAIRQVRNTIFQLETP